MKQTLIIVSEKGAEAIKRLRENEHEISSLQKDELINALTGSIRLDTFIRDSEEMEGWSEGIHQIQNVLCDYWEIRRDIEY